MTWTKGPWKWEKGEHVDDLLVLYSENGEEICNFGNDMEFYPNSGIEPSEANARLIAKAPEMAELLKRIISSKYGSSDAVPFSETVERLDELVVEASQILTEIERDERL